MCEIVRNITYVKKIEVKLEGKFSPNSHCEFSYLVHYIFFSFSVITYTDQLHVQEQLTRLEAVIEWFDVSVIMQALTFHGICRACSTHTV